MLYYLAERPIWKCVSLSQWHLNLEVQTTWLHSMVRFVKKQIYLSASSSFLNNTKVNGFSLCLSVSQKCVCMCTKTTHKTYTHAFSDFTWQHWMTAYHHPPTSTHNKRVLSQQSTTTHTLFTCLGKCITAANQDTFSLISAYKRCVFSAIVCVMTAWLCGDH